MSTVKEKAREIVEKLPDDATFEDLMYRIYVREKIEKGWEAIDEGRITSHEEVKRKFLAR